MMATVHHVVLRDTCDDSMGIKREIKWIAIVAISLAAVASFLQNGADAKKISQKLRIEKTAEKKNNPAIAPDEVWEDASRMNDSIRFSGYDKPVNAAREAILVSNNSQTGIYGIKIEITYKDMQGRMLHRREALIKLAVEPGETRKGEFKSWDSQKSYYYHLSQPPRRVATPYQIEIHPLSYLTMTR